MNARNFATVLVGSAALLASSSALSTSIPLPAGNIQFSFSTAVDAATTAYLGSCGGAGQGLAGGLACDAAVAPGIPTPGARTLAGGVKEDTWGVGSVTALSQGGSQFWNPGDNGEYLEFMFGGLYDSWIVQETFSTTTFSSGGFLEVWSHAAPTLPVDPDPNVRSGLKSYPGVTTGELLLSFAFAPGCSPIDPTATLCGSFSNSTFGGGSAFLLDVVGGTWKDRFDWNNPALGGADFSGSVTYRCAIPGPTGSGGDGCDPANNPGQVLFSLNLDGSVEGFNKVPVPSTLLVLAPALLLLGGAARRRMAK